MHQICSVIALTLNSCSSTPSLQSSLFDGGGTCIALTKAVTVLLNDQHDFIPCIKKNSHTMKQYEKLLFWFHKTYVGVDKRYCFFNILSYYDNLISCWAWIILLWNNFSPVLLHLLAGLSNQLVALLKSRRFSSSLMNWSNLINIVLFFKENSVSYLKKQNSSQSKRGEYWLQVWLGKLGKFLCQLTPCNQVANDHKMDIIFVALKNKNTHARI